jgi:outer membrane protein assembly factor BamB
MRTSPRRIALLTVFAVACAVTIGCAEGLQLPEQRAVSGGSVPPEKEDIDGEFPPGVPEEPVECVYAAAGYCAPATSIDCFEGRPEMLGVGSCIAGKRYCNEHGSAYGACLGQVLPQPDNCVAPTTWTCDGTGASCGVLERAEVLPTVFDSGVRIASDGGSGFVRSYVSSDEFELVFEREVDGQIAWSTAFQLWDADDAGAVRSLAVDAQGATVAVMNFELSPFPLSHGPHERASVVLKLDASGALQWAKVYSFGSQFWMEQVAVGAAGDIFVVGSFLGEIDFGLGPLTTTDDHDGFLLQLDTEGTAVSSIGWNSPTGAALLGVTVGPDGNVYVGGMDHADEQSCSYLSAVVGSFDPDGGLRWKRSFSSEMATAAGWSLVLDDAGHLYVSGRINTWMGNSIVFEAEPLDGTMFLTKLDTDDGEPLWSRSVNDIPHGPAIGGYLAIDPAGRIVWANQADYSVWIRTYDTDGVLLWTRHVPVNPPAPIQTDQYTMFIGWGLFGFAMRPDGHFAISGAFAGDIDFGAGPIESVTQWDGYYAVFAP